MIVSYLQKVAAMYNQLLALSIQAQLVYLGLITILTTTWLIAYLASRRGVRIFTLFFALTLSSVVCYYVNDFSVVLPFLLWGPSLLLATIVVTLRPSAAKSNLYTIKYQTSKGSVFIDLRRHMGIFGASGAGKTDSGFVPLIKHALKERIPISLYDYKDFELWEKILYFYNQEQKQLAENQLQGRTTTPLPELRCLYFKDPNYSDHFNFLDPRYLHSMEDVERISHTLFDNLYPGDGKDNLFFKESGASAFAGVVWRMKEDFSETCDFPHVSQVILNASAQELMEFIERSDRGKVLAAPFLKSWGNERQMAAVMSSLAAAVKKLSTPNMYQVLSRNDFDIGINKPDNKLIVGLINVPKYDTVYGPVLATIAQLMLDQVTERRREPMLCLWDEGSTFKLNRLDKLLATLRTYGIMVVWGLQDKVQGTLLYNENILRSILSNLGTKIMGKANDPDTAQFYSRLYETIKVRERSVSRGEGRTTTTTSFREKPKYQQVEFQRLKPGEFFFIDSEARDKKARVKPAPYVYEPQQPEKKHFYTSEQIEANFDRVVSDSKAILKSDTNDHT